MVNQLKYARAVKRPMALLSERQSDGSTRIVDTNQPPTNDLLLSNLRQDQGADYGETEVNLLDRALLLTPLALTFEAGRGSL
jgi:hypothetical protein